MKELITLAVAFVLVIVGVLYAMHGTLDRCPQCGKVLNTGNSLTEDQAKLVGTKRIANDFKFCIGCGYTNAKQWRDPAEAAEE